MVPVEMSPVRPPWPRGGGQPDGVEEQVVDERGVVVALYSASTFVMVPVCGAMLNVEA